MSSSPITTLSRCPPNRQQARNWTPSTANCQRRIDLARGSGTARQRYRYYVSKALIEDVAQKSATANTTPWRIPAREIEQLVIAEIAHLLTDPLGLAARAGLELGPADLPRVIARTEHMRGSLQARKLQDMRTLLTRVEVAPAGITLSLSPSALGTWLNLPLRAGASAEVHHHCDARLTRTGLAVKLVHGPRHGERGP